MTLLQSIKIPVQKIAIFGLLCCMSLSISAQSANPENVTTDKIQNLRKISPRLVQKLNELALVTMFGTEHSIENIADAERNNADEIIADFAKHYGFDEKTIKNHAIVLIDNTKKQNSVCLTEGIKIRVYKQVNQGWNKCNRNKTVEMMLSLDDSNQEFINDFSKSFKVTNVEKSKALQDLEDFSVVYYKNGKRNVFKFRKNMWTGCWVASIKNEENNNVQIKSLGGSGTAEEFLNIESEDWKTLQKERVVRAQGLEKKRKIREQELEQKRRIREQEMKKKEEIREKKWEEDRKIREQEMKEQWENEGGGPGWSLDGEIKKSEIFAKKIIKDFSTKQKLDPKKLIHNGITVSDHNNEVRVQILKDGKVKSYLRSSDGWKLTGNEKMDILKSQMRPNLNDSLNDSIDCLKRLVMGDDSVLNDNLTIVRYFDDQDGAVLKKGREGIITYSAYHRNGAFYEPKEYKFMNRKNRSLSLKDETAVDQSGNKKRKFRRAAEG